VRGVCGRTSQPLRERDTQQMGLFQQPSGEGFPCTDMGCLSQGNGRSLQQYPIHPAPDRDHDGRSGDGVHGWQRLRKELEGMAKPSLVFLLLFTSTGALFSWPSSSRSSSADRDGARLRRHQPGAGARTLSKLLSQPIYRRCVINGKFLAV